MEQLSEKEIALQLQDTATRRQAFSILVGQYSEMLYWKIRRIVMFHDDADDVLQNTLMKAWKSLDSFRGDSKLTTWLCRIAINESLDFIRHKQALVIVSSDSTAEIGRASCRERVSEAV